MERMQGNIERFEVVGRNFLLALQSSSSQPLVSPHHPEPSQHASQQAPSNLSKTYNQGPNTTQPPTFAPHPSQFLYDPNFTEFENFLSGDN
jgi:hypothetical protein